MVLNIVPICTEKIIWKKNPLEYWQKLNDEEYDEWHPVYKSQAVVGNSQDE